MKPDALRYTTVAIVLHWFSAVLILISFTLGLSMVDLPLSPKKLQWYAWHKWMGVTIFMLLALRLLWRVRHVPPPLPATTLLWQRRAAHVTHWAIYALLILIPISGWFRSAAAGVQVVYLGVLPLPNPIAVDKPLGEVLQIVHRLLNYALVALVVAHVAAAIKHHFVDKDTVLMRMLPFLRQR